jgi:phosphate transport system permease protein
MTGTETATRASSQARPRRMRRRRRSPRSQDALQIVGSVIAALGVALVAHSVFGLSGVFAIAIAAYLGFVVTFAIVEYAGTPRKDEQFVDLVAVEQSEGALERPSVASPPPALRVVDPEDIPDAPLKQRKVTRTDLVEAGVAALAGLMFAELLRVSMHMRSTLGFAIWWYVAFMVVYFLLVRDRNDPEAALDRIVTVAVWSIGTVAAATLVWMVGYVVVKGLPKLSGSFFTEDMSHVGPLTPGGGVKHAIIGTLEQVGLAILVVVPLGILTAVYLHEINGRLARPVRFIVDAMSGLPSIVAGLLLFTVWVKSHGYSGVAGAAALAVLMLPTMTRASEEILRTVPDTLREGALALGAPQHRLVRRVVLPTALSGLVTAALLSVARAIGETAPLLFTAFGADAVNTNPFHGAQSDLPLFIWARIRQPNQTQIDRAWTGALVLVIFVFVMFVAARIVANRGQRKLQGSR